MKTRNETRVLVVDGDPVTCENLRLYFRLHDLKARAASSGEQALRKLSEKPYDLVISEMDLSGINGFELLRKIHVRYPELPVILMTATPDAKLRDEAFTWDAADFLPRPLDFDELSLAVEIALHRSGEPPFRAKPAETETATAM